MPTHTARTPGERRLRAEALACRRGDRLLFEALDVDLGPGESLHVRGDNGVGKTSLLRLLAGLSPPAAGRVLWNDEDVARRGDDWRASMLFVGHQAGIKDDLTALENLRLAASLDGLRLGERAALDALDRMGLRGREDLPVRDMSQGQRRRVALSRLTWRKALVWILDEPLTALDAAAIELVAGLVRDHVDGGGLAVMTSHQTIPVAGLRELQL